MKLPAAILIGIVVLTAGYFFIDKQLKIQEELIGEVKLNQQEAALVKTKAVSGKFCGFNTQEAPLKINVVFSEIAWMGSLESPQDEWIELANIDSEPVDVSGWQIIDLDEQIKIVLKQNAVIPAAGFFLLKRGEDRLTNIRADVIYSGNLKNSQEGLRLFDNNCRLMDEILAQSNWPAGDNKSKRTMERNLKNLSWYTSAVIGGTPKKENSSGIQIAVQNTSKTTSSLSTSSTSTPQSFPIISLSTSTDISTSLVDNLAIIAATGSIAAVATETVVSSEPVAPPLLPPPAPAASAPAKILFSEIMAGIEGNANYEFIELYNAGGAAVDLTGWSIKKKTSGGSVSSLVAAKRLEGKIIQPKRYLLLADEEGYNGAVKADGDWAKSNYFAYTENTLILYNNEGNIADEVSWSEIPAGQSYRRVSWDSNNFIIESSPNPQNSFSQ